MKLYFVAYDEPYEDYNGDNADDNRYYPTREEAERRIEELHAQSTASQAELIERNYKQDIAAWEGRRREHAVLEAAGLCDKPFDDPRPVPARVRLESYKVELV